jgi:methyltransferase (TIGR00027 family)
VSEKRRIETKTSTTAAIMCLARAASYKDKRECYSGPDNIAYELVPNILKFIVRSRRLFKAFSRRYFAKGIYEYVIARTKYFDKAFTDALEQQFDQIVIFGAGFDSRALRFNSLNKSTTVFELDAPKTQEDKLKGYQSKKISVPKSLVFIPIDFNKEKLKDKLKQSGFGTGKKTLFVLEGVTMYLSESAVESTLRFISDSSSVGSKVVFDHIYAGVLRRENRYYGEKGMVERVAKAGEKWTFALEEDEAKSFLSKFGFVVEDNCGSKGLEERYFRDSKGVIVGKVNGIHSIVTAIRA